MFDVARNAASVSFENISKRFGEVTAVNDVSFRIEAGELVTLLGPSGCGKTTTLRLIAGLELPTGGRIRIGERDVTGLPVAQRDVAMVFQSYALFPHMTVFENVAYGLEMSRLAKNEVKERADAALELVGLPGYGRRLPSELSGGQQQRVAVARAFVLEPEVLLFDEPLSNLDAKLRRRVRDEIRDLQRRLGLTSVYVTHDQEEALAISDRIIVMNNAVIAQEGTPRELYEQPADRFVADFIGDANLLPVEITSFKDEQAEIRLGELTRRLPRRGLNGTEGRLAVRPEAFILHDTARPGTIEARVVRSSYLGSHVEYILASDHGEIFVVDGRIDRVLPPESAVWLELADHGVALVRD